MSELEYTEHGFRMTTDTNRHHRENGWDYRGKGVYHITLNVAERYPLFGELEGDNPEEARVWLNDYGMKVLNLLLDTPRYYSEKGFALKMLATQIMPDHMHIAIQTLAPIPQSIGQIIRGIKSACSSIYKREYCCPSDGIKVYREDIPKHFSRIFTRTGSIWEQLPEHYHERILHPTSDIDAMIRYIKDNPRRLWLKRANPDLFRIHQQTPIAGVSCTTLGNMFLYEHPLKAPLQCSRTLTQAEIDTRRNECLQEAANGTVFVSPAISEGEKQICRALREAGYPLIILLESGFPSPDSPHYRYFKPSGVYFEACAAGKLLLIEPSNSLFDRPDIEAAVYAKTGIPDLPHDAKRYRFVALNALAAEIASYILA